LAEGNQFNLNTVLLGAWSLLLSRYNCTSDVMFGVVRAGRPSSLDNAKEMVGLFLNVLPLRIRVPQQEQLIQWLTNIRQDWMELRDYEYTSLSQVHGWSDIPTDDTLFHSTVMFEHVRVSPSPFKQIGSWHQAIYLTNLVGYDDGHELRLRIDFDAARIDADSVTRMLAQLQTLFKQMVAEPQQRIAKLSPLNSGERQQLLIDWNSVTAEYPRSCLHEMFENQVERSPDAVAAIFEGEHLTYRELNLQANQLAHYLRKQGIGPDDLVPICANRSLEMVVGVLGVLKAGAAYVPIDPALPLERIAIMINDVSPRVVLMQEKVSKSVYMPQTSKVIHLEPDDAEWMAPDVPIQNPARTTTDTNLAYMIYTSGSTGKPKAVMVHHRAIANHIYWMQSTFSFDGGDCILQMTEFSFDVSVWEIFAPLIAGARLVIARPEAQRDPQYLAETIVSNQVTVLQLVPSLLRILLDTPRFQSCKSLRYILCGGEPMTEDIPNLFFEKLDCDLYNMYGPTEAAVDALYYCVPHNRSKRSIPIGRPVPNTRAYVLDHQLDLMPIGVAGELFLGGVQICRGYHNDPKLTSERFLPDVFAGVRGARLYKTGDKVRILPDGNLEFLGRIDDQVKLHGFRIELGEIQSVLRQHPAVGEAVAILRQDLPTQTRLVAYVTRKNSAPILASTLRDFLKRHLPSYMVPAAIVVLDGFPLTFNGKLDTGALPAPDGSAEPRTTLVAPRTETERVLTEIWAHVLKLQQFGVHERFFDLGGNSILSMQVMARANRAGLQIAVNDFLQNPTVAELASKARKDKGEAKQPVVVQLQRGWNYGPIYFLQPDPPVLGLVRLIDERYSIFTVEAPLRKSWRDALFFNRTSEFPTMGEFVAPYAAALLAHAGSVPCILVGYSYSGVMAFEAAHQLHEQGGRVEVVILLDSWVKQLEPTKVTRETLRCLWISLRGLSTGPLPQSTRGRLERLLLVARWLAGRLKNRIVNTFVGSDSSADTVTTITDDQNTPVPWPLIERLYAQLERDHIPRPLNSQGVLFRAGGKGHTKVFRILDQDQGWRNLFTKGLTIIQMTGDHHGMFRDPHNLALAKQLTKILEEQTRS
jgi:amino acid adenylation domain-containing protein